MLDKVQMGITATKGYHSPKHPMIATNGNCLMIVKKLHCEMEPSRCE